MRSSLWNYGFSRYRTMKTYTLISLYAQFLVKMFFPEMSKNGLTKLYEISILHGIRYNNRISQTFNQIINIICNSIQFNSIQFNSIQFNIFSHYLVEDIYSHYYVILKVKIRKVKVISSEIRNMCTEVKVAKLSS